MDVNGMGFLRIERVTGVHHTTIINGKRSLTFVGSIIPLPPLNKVNSQQAPSSAIV